MKKLSSTPAPSPSPVPPLPKNLIEIIAFKNHGLQILALLKFNYTNPFGFYNINNTVSSYSIISLESKKEYEDCLTLGVIDESILPSFTSDWIEMQTYNTSYIFPHPHIALCTPRQKLVIDTLETILKQELSNLSLLNYSFINFDIHKILSQDIESNKSLKESGQKIFLNNYLLTMSYKFCTPPYSLKEAETLVTDHSIDVMHRKLKLKLKTRYGAAYIKQLYPMTYKDVKQAGVFSDNTTNSKQLVQLRASDFNKGHDYVIEALKDYLLRWTKAIESKPQYVEYEKTYFSQNIPKITSPEAATVVVKKSHKI